MKELEAIKKRAEGHTEGPWVIAADVPTWESEEGSFDVGPDDAPTVAVVEGLANADLIAAAPKLIAALEAVEKLAANFAKADADLYSDDFNKGHCAGNKTAASLIRQAISEALQ